jgi:hypothetical protein
VILGRTSSGAIKTKSDGGLRAVECACCGECGGCSPHDFSIYSALFSDPAGMPFYGVISIDNCGVWFAFDANSEFQFGDVILNRGYNSATEKCGVVLSAILWDQTYSLPCPGGSYIGTRAIGSIFLPDTQDGVNIIGSHLVEVFGDGTNADYCCQFDPSEWYAPDACPAIPYQRTVTIQIQ